MKRITYFFKEERFLLFSILINIIVYFRWFSFRVLGYADGRYFFKETLTEKIFPALWSSSDNLGQINYTMWRYPLDLLYALFGKLSFDLNVAEKFLLLWPLVILTPIAGYFLVKKFTDSNMGAFFGSLFFSFNTYFISSNSHGHAFLIMSFVLGTLSLLLFVKSEKCQNELYLIISAILLTISTFYDLRGMYLSFVVVFLYFFYKLFFSEQKNKRIRQFCFYLIIFFLLNIYWIVGFLSTNFFSASPILERGLFGSSFWKITYSLSTQHPFWNFYGPQWFLPQNLIIYFWIIPILAFISLLLKPKKEILLFSIIAIIGIFLSKQTSHPFPEIYSLLFENFPGFNAFRESTKFYFLIIISFTVLLGYFIKNIMCYKNKLIKTLSLLLIFVILIVNTYPIFSGNQDTWFVKREIPSDYFIYKNFIINDNNLFNILWVPRFSRWSYTSNDQSIISLADNVNGLWGQYNKSLKSPITTKQKIENLIKNERFNEILDKNSIKYIIVPFQDIKNNDNFFKDYDSDPDFFEKLIVENLNLTKRYIGQEKLIIFLNPNFRPKLYITNLLDNLEEESFKEVSFDKENDVTYNIYLNNLSDLFYLQFTESFNSGWKIRINDDSINSHRNEIGTNSFLIDPQYIKDNYPKEYYKENPDGSIDVEIVLYFKPQSYFYIGLLISGMTLIACIGYLVWEWGRGEGRRMTFIRGLGQRT